MLNNNSNMLNDINYGGKKDGKKDGGKKKDTQKFIGEGSYGCVVKPGLDCKGKKNLLKNSVTKITEINFFSKNELYISRLIRKNISSYKNYFSPVFNSCVIKFNKIINSDLNIDKCEHLLENINYDYGVGNIFGNTNNIFSSTYNMLFDKKFFMFYVRFIKGDKQGKSVRLTKHLLKFNVPYDFIKNYALSYYYLLNSIYLLQNSEYFIVHNDLYDRNILYDIKRDKPIIIDFGLTYDVKKIYKLNKHIDITYMHKFFHDFRPDHYQYITEKRFIQFCTNNNSFDLNIHMTTNYQKNELTSDILKIFIKDAMETIRNNIEIAFVFSDEELKQYESLLYSYYNKFLNKKLYPTYSSIVNELLPIVFEYTDLYSLSIEFITIYYSKFYVQYKTDLDNNPILKLFLQLFKKTIFPDPKYRANCGQLKTILKFIFDFINDNNIGDFDNNEKYIAAFFQQFKAKLDDIGIIYEDFNNENFAFIDFDAFLNKTNVEYIQKIQIKF